MAMNPLQALFSGHAPAGPPQGQPSSISVQDHGGPAPESAGGLDAVAALQRAIQATHQAAVIENDQVEKQQILKCLTILQGILANDQKHKEAALGTTAAHKGMAKASAGGY